MRIFSKFHFYLNNKEEIHITRSFEDEKEKYDLINRINEDIVQGNIIVIEGRINDDYTLHIPSKSINYYKHEK